MMMIAGLWGTAGTVVFVAVCFAILVWLTVVYQRSIDREFGGRQ